MLLRWTWKATEQSKTRSGRTGCTRNGITMRADYQQQGLRKAYADATSTNYRTTEDRWDHKKSSDMLLGEEESEAKRDEAG